MNKYNFRIATIFLLFVAFTSCDKTVVNSNIPYVYVYEQININDPEFYALRANGNSILLSDVEHGYIAGYAGLIITRNEDKFYAFDQCCTHNPTEKHRLKVNGALATCPVDSSQFFLLDGFGYPIKGPAKYPLKTYKVTYNNTNSFTISNY